MNNEDCMKEAWFTQKIRMEFNYTQLYPFNLTLISTNNCDIIDTVDTFVILVKPKLSGSNQLKFVFAIYYFRERRINHNA